MKKYLASAVFGVGTLGLLGLFAVPTSFFGAGTVGVRTVDAGAKTGSAYAAASTRIVTLAVQGMYCISCVYIVKSTLAAVPGVSRVDVTPPDRAVVTYDNSKTSVPALINATTRAGYPSARKS